MSHSTVYRIQFSSSHHRASLPYIPLNDKNFKWLVLGNQDAMSIIDLLSTSSNSTLLTAINNDIQNNYRDYFFDSNRSIHTFYGISDKPIELIDTVTNKEFYCMMLAFINFKKYEYNDTSRLFEINNIYDQTQKLLEILSSLLPKVKIYCLNSFDTSDVILLILFNDMCQAKDISISLHKYIQIEFVYNCICINNYMINTNPSFEKKFNLTMSMNTNDLASFNVLKNYIDSSSLKTSLEVSVGFDNLKLYIDNASFQDLLSIQTKDKIKCEGFKTDLQFSLFENDFLNLSSMSNSNTKKFFHELNSKIRHWINLITEICQFNNLYKQSYEFHFLKPQILDALYEISINLQQFIKLRSLDDILFQILKNLDIYFYMINTVFRSLQVLPITSPFEQRKEMLDLIDENLLIDYIKDISILLGQTINPTAEIIQNPAFSTTTFDYPVKLGLFYNALCNKIASHFFNTENNDTTLMSGTSIVPAIISGAQIRNITISKQTSSKHKALICYIQLPGRMLYSQANLMINLTHEIAHSTLDFSKDRRYRFTCFMRAVALGITIDLNLIDVHRKMVFFEMLNDYIIANDEYNEYYKEYFKENNKKNNFQGLAKIIEFSRTFFLDFFNSSIFNDLVHKFELFKYEGKTFTQYLKYIDFHKPLVRETSELCEHYLKEGFTNNKIKSGLTLWGRIELIANLFYECFADVAMLLTLNPTFDDYITALMISDIECPSNEGTLLTNTTTRNRIFLMMHLFENEAGRFSSTLSITQYKSIYDAYINSGLSKNKPSAPLLTHEGYFITYICSNYFNSILENLKTNLSSDFSNLFSVISAGSNCNLLFQTMHQYIRDYYKESVDALCAKWPDTLIEK